MSNVFATVSPRLHVVGTLCVIDVFVTSVIVECRSLEELVLSYNDLSKDDRLSDCLSTLTSLKKLDMRKCDLSQLPEG